jgi:predicted dinucleotide-binding enzyme
MTTAIVGVGNIGGAVARHLVAGGESVVLAAKEESNAEALAGELGPTRPAPPSRARCRLDSSRSRRRISGGEIT